MEAAAVPISTNTNEKIEKVLQTFLKPNVKIKNHGTINKFLNHLVDKYGKLTDRQQTEQFCRWIIEASKLWGNSNVTPPMAILSFSLNLTSHLSSNEHIFFDLNSKNVYEQLVGVAQRNSIKDPTVTHDIISLLSSFLEHKTGVLWVMATIHWTDIIKLGLTADTTTIKEKAYHFITKLLEKAIVLNRNFGVILVGRLIKPLKDIFQSITKNKDSPNPKSPNAERLDSLKPTLEFLADVTSTLLKRFIAKALILFLQQDISEIIDKILLLSQDEDLSFKLLRVQFVFLFYKMCVKVEGLKVVADDSPELRDITIMFDLMSNEIEKNNVRCVIKICDFAHNLYCSVASRMPLCIKKGGVIEFQTQMVLFQFIPLMVLSIQILGEKATKRDKLLKDDFRREFSYRLVKIAAVKSMQAVYKWMESLKVKPDLMEDVTFSLRYIVKTKDLLNKERAATMFPALVYVLSDTLIALKQMKNVDWTPRAIEFSSTLVETIADLVESFDLTWKDSIETIRVMELAYDFLHEIDWPEKIIIIKGLKLLNTAISKYMCPDMVLLIYSTKDSTVSKTGNLLYTKCHDSCWEIRDSALEVLYTLALNARSKFPALADVLLDAKLPQLILDMAMEDDEYTVRTTAFRCLQELIQMEDIWDVLLDIDEFLDSVLCVFENETEGLVRKEAAILVFKIYEKQHFPDELLPRLYDVMTHATLKDLHWEVRFNAMDFWMQCWYVQLTKQGMIDLSFPSHTFSPELKKIVALTEAEVKKRVIKVLNQLGNCGCLYVMKCVQFDRNSEVSKKAVSFHHKLVGLFRRYKIPSESIDLSGPSDSVKVQDGPRYQQLYEPISPAGSTTISAGSPVDPGSLESLEFDGSEYFITLSSQHSFNFDDLDHMTLTDPSTLQTSSSQFTDISSQSNEISSGSSTDQQEVPDLNSSITGIDPLFGNPVALMPFPPFGRLLDYDQTKLTDFSTSQTSGTQGIHTPSHSKQISSGSFTDHQEVLRSTDSIAELDPLFSNTVLDQSMILIDDMFDADLPASASSIAEFDTLLCDTIAVTPPSSFTPLPELDQLKLTDSPTLQTSITQGILTSPQSSHTSSSSSTDKQELSGPTGFTAGLDPILSNAVANQSINLIGDVDMLGTLDEGFKDVSANDVMPNNTDQIKRKEYLAPSQYVKFVYDEVEMREAKKPQLNNVDEFESLLDELLK